MGVNERFYGRNYQESISQIRKLSLPKGISGFRADAFGHRVDDRMFEIDETWSPVGDVDAI